MSNSKLIITWGTDTVGAETFSRQWAAEHQCGRVYNDRAALHAALGMCGIASSDKEEIVSSMSAGQRKLAYANNYDIVTSAEGIGEREVRAIIEEAIGNGYVVENRTFGRNPSTIKVNKMVTQAQDTVRDRNLDPGFTNDEQLPKAILVDLDGTLFHANNRDIYDLTRVDTDDVDDVVLDMLHRYADDYAIVLMSGRKDSCREDTIRALEKCGAPYTELHMRADKDNRPDWAVKRDLVMEHIHGNYHVSFCLDDRNQVVDYYRDKFGFKVLQVAPGDF